MVNDISEISKILTKSLWKFQNFNQIYERIKTPTLKKAFKVCKNQSIKTINDPFGNRSLSLFLPLFADEMFAVKLINLIIVNLYRILTFQ